MKNGILSIPTTKEPRHELANILSIISSFGEIIKANNEFNDAPSMKTATDLIAEIKLAGLTAILEGITNKDRITRAIQLVRQLASENDIELTNDAHDHDHPDYPYHDTDTRDIA